VAEWSALEQAKSVISTIRASFHSAKWIADPETVAARMEICEVCPKLKIGKRGWRGCVVCGCSYRRKVIAHETACPLGKW